MYLVRQETQEALKERQREAANLRQLAVALGFPASYNATLSDILRGRPGAITLDGENKLRKSLGLPPIPRRLAVACPTCGVVHSEGLDCHGQPIADVVILRPGQHVVTPSTAPAKRRPRKRRLRKTIHCTPETWERLNTARQAAGLTWEEFLSRLS